MKRFFLITLYILISVAIVAAGNWDGLYRWDNPTKKTNKGKMEHLLMRVVTNSEGMMEVYLVRDEGEYRIHPFLSEKEEYGEWHDYKEDSKEAESYRMNNTLFNTSSHKPSKWMMVDSSEEEDCLKASIVSKALGIEVTTDATYRFQVDETGVKTLTFATDCNKKIARGYLFFNPDPASDGSFVLKNVSEEGTV